MDAHTVYARDYIRQCVCALRESGADNVGGPWVAEGRGTVGNAIAAAFRSRFCTGGGKSHDAGYEGDVDTVYLGCWKRSVFDKIGLFDPALVRNQDDEFNFRLRRSGGRIWQSPRIRSSYTPRSSLKALFRQYLQYGFWKVAILRKHRALASWRHAAPALLIASILLSSGLIALSGALGLTAIHRVLTTAAAAGLLVYCISCIAAALPFAGALEWRAFAILPVVIAEYHFAYGIGFLMGLMKRPGNEPGRIAPAKLFTALTR
jgi:hypothetical protein